MLFNGSGHNPPCLTPRAADSRRFAPLAADATVRQVIKANLMTEVPSVSANAGGRGRWTLAGEGDRLVFTRADTPEVRAFARRELPGNVQVSGLLGRFTPGLVAHLPKPILFRVSVPQAEQLLSWLGPPPPGQLAFEVNRRFRALIPFGIVFVALSLPFGTQDFDLIGFLQTSLLLFTGLAAFRAPGRYVFLLDAAWFAFISVWWLILVVLGARSPYFLLWLPFNVNWIVSDFRLFAYFRPQGDSGVDSPESSIPTEPA